MTTSSECFSLLYLSHAAVPFSTEQLKELLLQARANNASLDITGMLLFKDRNFLQILEGKKESVLALYDKISRDSRHARITALAQGRSPQRDFPDWSMGFHDLSSPETLKVPGFSTFLDTSLTSSDLAKAGRAKKLMLLFKEQQLA